MAGKVNGFSIKCEGDCERICKVFIEWLKTDSPELKKPQTITAPNAQWAPLFSEIYTSEVENNDLADIAENNVVEITFNVMDVSLTDLSKLSTEQLNDLLEEFLEEYEEDNDNEFEDD